MRSGFRWLKAFAGGNAKQVNVAGDNFGPIYLGPQHARRHVHQLPAAPADFCGRLGLVAQVRRRLIDGAGPRVVNLYGIPGVGKSALALRLAHTLSAEHYPDHQLYFDLREYDDLGGHDQRQGTTYDLLGGALVALGTAAAEVPSGRGPRAAAYRSALSADRTLVMIDNASTAAEVEPLLPGHFRSAVIITSWAPVTDLPGVQAVAVQVLGDDEAIDMLQAVSGRVVRDADRAVAGEIVRGAGHLPLALRIAGGLLKARPAWTWNDLRERLTGPDGIGRIDRFATGRLAVQKTFDLAYGDLGTDPARAYRLLGLAPSPRISRALARVLIDPDPAVAGDLTDDLAARELLQVESDTTLRMHGLLWQRARDLVADDDPALRTQAEGRMTAWALARLDQDYLPRFRLDLQLPAEMTWLASSAEVFVESPLDDPDGDGAPVVLADIFPHTPRLVLVAGGGSGKTTLVNHLCVTAARRRLDSGSGPIPLIALIRDIPGSGDGDVVTLLLRTLRHRYGLDMTVDALQVALRGGHVFAVLDGLDELADRALRRTVVTSIRAFAAAYPQVALLVTSRPYHTLNDDLPGFRAVTIRPWTSEVSEAYLAALLTNVDVNRSARTARDLLRVAADSGILSGPLALQMLVVHYRRHRRLPATHTELIEMFIVDTIENREASRGTLYFPPALLRELLESVAFTMQSDDANRMTIAFPDVLRAMRRATPPGKEFRAEVVLSGFADRTGLLREIGDWNSPGSSVFAFTHTIYREHLAAAHLARRTAKEVASCIAEHGDDASWGGGSAPHAGDAGPGLHRQGDRPSPAPPSRPGRRGGALDRLTAGGLCARMNVTG